MLLEMNVKLRRGSFDLKTHLSVNDTSTGLFGKSGAGKTTVLGLIAGTIQPHSGHIVLDGKTLFDSKKGIIVPREQRSVGAVLQVDCRSSNETARDYLSSAYYRTLAQRRLFKLDFLIELLELGSLLDQPLTLLSDGERQRVALARSLLKSPKLLLLDETFAVIGEAFRKQLIPILKRLHEELNLSLMYASQSLGEILELTEQLVILDHGRVLRSGSLRDMVKQLDVLRYLGLRQIDNVLPISVRGHDYQAGCSLADSFGLPLMLPLRPNITVGTQAQVSIRANDIALSRAYIEGISIQNQLKGRICALIPSGESMIVQVDCGGTLLAEITPAACRNMGLQEGESIYCLIKAHSINYLNELETLPQQRVISYGDRYYFLGASGLESALIESMTVS